MKYILLLLPFLSLQLFAKDFIELVESIPIETTLDNEDIRNTSEVWIEMINSAKKSLNFGEFYISHQKGKALEPVLASVYAAANRGVKIRFILDGNMYSTYPETADELNKHKNITVQVYKLKEITGGVLHAKYFIVDNKEIFIGSQNFDWRALEHIHELGIRVRSKKLVSFYSELFDLDWQLSAENVDSESILKNIKGKNQIKSVKLKTKEYGLLNIIPTASNPKIIFNNENWDEIQLLKLIHSAKGSIRIQLLSYSPLSHNELYEKLDLALRSAAARGVQVQMILSDWNFYSPRIDYIKSLQAIPNIDIKFSTIPEASTGYVGFARVEHCKYLLIDSDRMWLGTSNWSKSYFYNGRNLGMVIENQAITERVNNIFLKSWDSSYCQVVELGKKYERKLIAE